MSLVINTKNIESTIDNNLSQTLRLIGKEITIQELGALLCNSQKIYDIYVRYSGIIHSTIDSYGKIMPSKRVGKLSKSAEEKLCATIELLESAFLSPNKFQEKEIYKRLMREDKVKIPDSNHDINNKRILQKWGNQKNTNT